MAGCGSLTLGDGSCFGIPTYTRTILDTLLNSSKDTSTIIIGREVTIDTLPSPTKPTDQNLQNPWGMGIPESQPYMEVFSHITILLSCLHHLCFEIPLYYFPIHSETHFKLPSFSQRLGIPKPPTHISPQPALICMSQCHMGIPRPPSPQVRPHMCPNCPSVPPCTNHYVTVTLSPAL